MEENENKLPENQEGTKDSVQENPELPSKSNDSEEILSEIVEEKSSVEVVESEVASGEQEENTIEANEEHADEDHEDEDVKLLETLHFDNPTKQELFEALKKVAHMKNMRILDQALKEVKTAFDEIYENEKESALKGFLEDGNEADDFVYKGEEIDHEFLLMYDNLRHKKQQYFNDLEKSKEDNLIRKNEILEKLRELVDGEESTTSINGLKALQEEWKKIGPIPGAHVKTMWANYNAIVDRFYDNRSIYFELKELDRKKNLENKLELCDKAEALVSVENIKEAIVQLNDLHEEFKHIGPVPKEEQEIVWQRFKAASDEIYHRRKDHFESLKKELGDNADKKMALGDEAAKFLDFQSDRISEWNKKTKEILELQKKWDGIGGLPRDQAKDINKHFWNNFKTFFSNKNSFFKTLESQREENLKAKQTLLEKALELQASEEWDKAANELKKLQNQWREIGPVPEKFRNEIYQQFKEACDKFFDRKRENGNAQSKEFDANLKKKEEICAKLESYMQSDTIELELVYEMLDEYAEIGFVPRNAIKSIHNRFDEVTDKLMAMEELTKDQRNELRTQIQLSKLKNSPHGTQKINRKETAIKRKISSLEGDIDTLKTNMDFFASSKNADKFKEEIKLKIQSAEKEIDDLKHQLELLKHL